MCVLLTMEAVLNVLSVTELLLQESVTHVCLYTRTVFSARHTMEVVSYVSLVLAWHLLASVLLAPLCTMLTVSCV
jgi:hypothetical protein